MLIWGFAPIPIIEILERGKMKENSRETRIEIRMNLEEKERIKRLAYKTGKSVSAYMRQTALGYKIKEKPSKEFYIAMNKLNTFIKILDEMERLLYHKNFIDERILKEELIKLKNFRKEIRENFL